MCGITGFLTKDTRDIESRIRSMTCMLKHRGPDESDVWIDQTSGIAFGHARLSILDLSPLGHQPMHSESGRYVIIYNGEIYNHRDVRDDLQKRGQLFKGHSDTEIMLAAFEQYGLEQALQKLNGMFAFALYDKQERVLHLARDRMGEKPLYYGWLGERFFFGSELTSFKAHPDFKPGLSTGAISLFLRYSYIPSPYSIYQDIYKLIPGTSLSISSANFYTKPAGFSPHVTATGSSPVSYWSLLEKSESPLPETSRTFASCVNHCESLISDSVRLRLVSDVPLGAFLSGGVDSSLIVAMMQKHATAPVRTFSIGFEERAFDEASHARRVAHHIGTDHTELYVTAKDSLDVVPLLASFYDEPFADASQIPTYLVSKLARTKVTVSLSGDGGDELFAGYPAYRKALELKKLAGTLPKILTGSLAGLLHTVSPELWDTFANPFSALLQTKHSGRFGNQVHRAAEILKAESNAEMYSLAVSHWVRPPVLREERLNTAYDNERLWNSERDFIRQMMITDMLMYLPDAIMTKVDRASMAVSLESRAPLLDHRLVEFALSVPSEFHMDKGEQKKILKEVLYKYVPKNLVDRPKMGFGVPVRTWLRGPLKPWAEDLMSADALDAYGILDTARIRKYWKNFSKNNSGWEQLIWNVLTLQAWLRAGKCR